MKSHWISFQRLERESFVLNWQFDIVEIEETKNGNLFKLRDEVDCLSLSCEIKRLLRLLV